jgi:hypothetical protein
VPAITVAIYDDLHLSLQILAAAQDEAMRIYRKAGVTTSWIVCKSSTMEVDLRCQDLPSATHLNLRIVQHASKASDGIFGVAFLSAEGTGAYTDVSYNSVEESWHRDELRRASMGALLFSEEQARFMRERLARELVRPPCCLSGVSSAPGCWRFQCCRRRRSTELPRPADGKRALNASFGKRSGSRGYYGRDLDRPIPELHAR